MDEPQYVIRVYEECSPLAVQESDVHKVAITSDSFQTSSSSSSVYVSSTPCSNNISPRTTLPINQFIKEGVQNLSQTEILESKPSPVSHLSILPSNVLNNSFLSLQGDTVLSEESRVKVENGNEMVIGNQCYGTLDCNGSTAYRLLLAPLPYSTLIKNNLSDKGFDQTLLSSGLQTSGITGNDALLDEVEGQVKDENWANNNVSPLVLSTSSPPIKGKKGPAQSQVVVKLLQDDLNFDMVEIISPNLDNSQIFEIIEKDNEVNKTSINKEVTNDISSAANLKFITTSDDSKIGNQQNDDLADINPNFNVVYNCSLCNKFFSSESTCNEHRKMCLPYTNSSDSVNKDSHLHNDINSIFQTRTTSSNDKKIKSISKPNLVWRCLICSQEFTNTLNLKIHYVSHSIEELSTALLKCTIPTNSKNDKTSNTDHSTVMDAENPANIIKIVNNLGEIDLVSSSGDSKKKISNVKSTQENALHPNAENEHNDESKSFTAKSSDSLSPLKNKPYSKSKKVKTSSKPKAKSGLKSRDPHSCPVCKKFLSSRGNLAKHLIQHETVKPWVCKVCGSGFNSKRNHDYHYMQRHTTLRPSVCSICGKGYTNNRTLKEHMVFHQKEKEFSCLLCGKEFRTKKCVNRHMQRHETNRRFVCNLCFKPFRVHIDLVSHFRLVHNSDNKKPKSKSSNMKSQSANCVSHQFPQSDSSNQNMINKKAEGNLRAVDNQQITMTEEQMQSTSTPDQLNKIKDFSDLLQSHSTTILPDISNDFNTSSINGARGDPLVNGENIDAQTIIPVSSAPEEVVYNSTYGLTLHNKHDVMNPDLASPGTYVVIGLADSQPGAENSSDKSTWNTLNEYKTVYQDPGSKETSSSQNVTEIGLLPAVLENISRPFPDVVEEDTTANDDNVLTKPLRTVLSIDKAVDEKNFRSSIGGSKMNEVSKEDSLTSDTQTQTLNLDLLSQTLHLDFQSTHGNSAPAFL